MLCIWAVACNPQYYFLKLFNSTQALIHYCLSYFGTVWALYLMHFDFLINLKFEKMAQLHVQKKRSQLSWLWIIIILLVLGVVYYLLVQNNVLPDTFNLKTYHTSLTQADKNYFIV